MQLQNTNSNTQPYMGYTSSSLPATVTTTPVVPTAPVTAPQEAPVTANSTISNLYGTQPDTEYGTYLNDPQSYEATRGVSEERERSNLAGELQRQIDASNALYSQKLREAKILGEARLGATRSGELNRGTVGGNVATAATDVTTNANTETYNQIEEQRVIAEAGIRSMMEQKAQERYEKKSLAMSGNLKDRVAYLKGQSAESKTRGVEVADYLIANNVDPTSITQEEAKKAGTTLAEIKNAFTIKQYADKQKKAEEAKKIADATAVREAEQADRIALEQAKPVTVSEGQRMYERDPKTGKLVQVAYNPKTYAPVASTYTGDTPGSILTGNPEVDGWVALIQKEEAVLPNVPMALRTAVANALSKSPLFKEKALANLQIVNEVLKNAGAISGPVQSGIIPFTKGATTGNQYKQLKGLLALDSRKKLEGSGAISDFESKTLERAASSLGRNQSEKDFEDNLKKVRGVFQTAAGMPADVRVTNQNGEVDEGKLTRDEINDAIIQGFTVEYQ